MSLDPSKYSTLALTHVQYDSTDPLAKLLSLVTLSPIFLLCSYLTIILYRRELTFINALIGQVTCEALNWALKRSFRQPRPTDFLGSGYGMPSSHSQFLGFFSSFFLLHFYFHSPTFNKTSLISLLRKLEHALGMVAVFALTVAVCYSRYHLSYHTPAQILIGLGIGLLYGSIYYHFTETLTRRFSFSLQDVEKSMERNDRTPNPQDNNKTIRDSNLRQRSPKPNRFSTSTSISTSKSQVISIRQSILDHPIAIAFRIRDSWLVWKDGGVEGEYGIWRREWENRRESSSSSSSSSSITTLNNQSKLDQFISIIQGKEVSREKLDLMKLALNEADKCLPLVTAFSVGCVITVEALLNEKDRSTSQNQEITLSTGYSRELEGNTHAEQCALTKLISNYDLLSTSPANSSAKWNGNVVGDIDLNLYTTMEPCSERLSGQDPCVDRILKFNQENHLLRLSDLIEIMKIESIESSNNSKVSNRFVRLKIKRIFQGVKEPEDFVLCKGTRLLQENGISVEQIRDGAGGTEEDENNWLELECLRIAKKGHQDQPGEIKGNERRWK